MISDASLQLSSAQVITAGIQVSTNTLDRGALGLQHGYSLDVHFQVDTTFTGGTSITPQLITSATANLASPTVIGGGPLIPVAALVAGARFAVGIPPAIGQTGQRFFGVQYVTVGVMTTGAMSAMLADTIEDHATYGIASVIL